MEKKIQRKTAIACTDHGLLKDGDHVMVCLSGGKDSYTLLNMLIYLQGKAPVDFKITAFHLDQNQPGYPIGIMEDYLKNMGIEYICKSENTYDIVQEKIPQGKTTCSLCSRLRRGIIYTTAEKLGCNKIALGHHRDDTIETLMMNLFHTGQLKAMPAIYTTDDGRFEVIRPMVYVPENWIIEYSEQMKFPIIPCNLCGSQQTQRVFVKGLLNDLEKTIPHVRQSMLSALKNVKDSHLMNLEKEIKQLPTIQTAEEDALF